MLGTARTGPGKGLSGSISAVHRWSLELLLSLGSQGEGEDFHHRPRQSDRDQIHTPTRNNIKTHQVYATVVHRHCVSGRTGEWSYEPGSKGGEPRSRPSLRPGERELTVPAQGGHTQEEVSGMAGQRCSCCCRSGEAKFAQVCSVRERRTWLWGSARDSLESSAECRLMHKGKQPLPSPPRARERGTWKEMRESLLCPKPRWELKQTYAPMSLVALLSVAKRWRGGNPSVHHWVKG